MQCVMKDVKHCSDKPAGLKIVGEISWQKPQHFYPTRQAARILTGAVMPSGRHGENPGKNGTARVGVIASSSWLPTASLCTSPGVFLPLEHRCCCRELCLNALKLPCWGCRQCTNYRLHQRPRVAFFLLVMNSVLPNHCSRVKLLTQPVLQL